MMGKVPGTAEKQENVANKYINKDTTKETAEREKCLPLGNVIGSLTGGILHYLPIKLLNF